MRCMVHYNTSIIYLNLFSVVSRKRNTRATKKQKLNRKHIKKKDIDLMILQTKANDPLPPLPIYITKIQGINVWKFSSSNFTYSKISMILFLAFHEQNVSLQACSIVLLKLWKKSWKIIFSIDLTGFTPLKSKKQVVIIFIYVFWVHWI